MKRRVKLVLSIILIGLVLLTNLGYGQANEYPVSPQTGVVLTTKPNENIIYELTFNVRQDKSVIIETIKEIRSRQYDKNPWIPSDGGNVRLQDLVARHYPNKEAYVNGFSWDSNLEKIALQRAVETKVHGEIDHKRASSDSDWNLAMIPDVASINGEVIAWSWSAKSGLYLFEMEEVYLPKDSTSSTTGVIGHLMYVISPFNKNIGLASIDGVLLGVQSYQHSGATETLGFSGATALQVAIDKNRIEIKPKETKIEALLPQGEEIEENPNEYVGYTLEVRPAQKGEKKIYVEDHFYRGVLLATTQRDEIVKEPVLTKKVVGIKVLPADEVRQEAIPFVERQESSQDLYVGQTKLSQTGENGTKEITKTYYVENNQLLSKEVESIVKPAVDKVTLIGQKPLPETKVEVEKIPFEVKYEDSSELFVGQEKVKIEGVDGTKTTTTTYQILNNELKSNENIEVVNPKESVRLRGIKPLPSPKVEEKELPFETKEEKTQDLYLGQSEVKEEGKTGIQEVTTTYVIENNELTEKLTSKILKPAVDKVILIGQKDLPEDEIISNEKIPFDMKEKKTKDLYIGQSQLLQLGKDGYVITKKVAFVKDNELKFKEVVEKQDKIDQVTLVGSKEKDKPKLLSQNLKVWFKSSQDILEVKTNPEFSTVVKTYVDGEEITLLKEEGSTIFKLSSAQLEQMKTGKHTLVMAFEEGRTTLEGEVETTFEIKEKVAAPSKKPTKPMNTKKNRSPQTSDMSFLGEWMSLSIASVGLGFIAISKKKK